MGRLVRFDGPRRISIATYPEPPLAPGEVRLETVYSGISAGTELTAYRATNPYLSQRWDTERKLFVGGEPSLGYPIDTFGYEEVGCVVEVGPDVDAIDLGQLVWGQWGHRSTKVVPAEWATARVLDDRIPPVCGIFSYIGAIALNAIIDADIHVGETVAVFGLGVAGQLVAQLAKLNGATVVGVDAVPARLALARKLGADHVLDYSATDPAEEIRLLTDGRKADVSVEISGVYPALQSAVRSTAYNSRVVAAGFFQGDGTGLRLGEEFHHNRIQIVCAQIFGMNARVDHRWDAWRLQSVVMRLLADGSLDAEPLITHVLPAERAAEGFALLDSGAPDVMQMVLDFTSGQP